MLQNKGFTLIELLVVIALLGIVMAVLIVGIDPIDKLNAANDAKVQADISEIGTAFESNATASNGTYAANQNQLLAKGDLRSILTPPVGYCGNANVYSIGTLGGSSQSVWCYANSSGLKSKRNLSKPKWIWCSSTGKVSAEDATYNCP